MSVRLWAIVLTKTSKDIGNTNWIWKSTALSQQRLLTVEIYFGNEQIQVCIGWIYISWETCALPLPLECYSHCAYSLGYRPLSSMMRPLGLSTRRSLTQSMTRFQQVEHHSNLMEENLCWCMVFFDLCEDIESTKTHPQIIFLFHLCLFFKFWSHIIVYFCSQLSNQRYLPKSLCQCSRINNLEYIYYLPSIWGRFTQGWLLQLHLSHSKRTKA